MARKDRLEELLKNAFDPSYLDVADESHLHAGHSGNPDGSGESHYRVVISAAPLQSVSRVVGHRLIYQAVNSEMTGDNPIHALAIEIKS